MNFSLNLAKLYPAICVAKNRYREICAAIVAIFRKFVAIHNLKFL